MTRISRIQGILMAAAILLLPTATRAEERILWVSIGDSPQTQSAVQAAIDFAVAQRFNGICILARYRADALYQPNRDFSTYTNNEPRRYPTFDTVQYVIDHGREVGLRIYAAFGCFMVSDGDTAPYPSVLPSGSILWIYKGTGAANDTTYLPDAGYPRAMTTTDDATGLWCDPGRNDIQIYTRSVLKDFIQNYDVDGIILDRIRYRGDSSPHRNAAYGYNPQALTDLVGKGYIANTTPAPGATTFLDARRYAIRDFVRDAGADVRALKPWVIYGATPIVYSTTLTSTYYFEFQYFPYWNSGANTGHTNGLGLLDLITPQYYRTTAATNASLMDLAKPDVTNMFHEGSFSSYYEGAAELAQNICDTRNVSRGTKGFQIFSMDDTAVAGYMSTLNGTATTCGTNVMGATSPKTAYTLKVNWDDTIPNSITNLAANTATAAQVALTWSVPAAAGDGDVPVRYLVYRSATSPVKQYYANLVNRNFTVTGSSFNDTPATGLSAGTWYYKVIPVDDYNNRSGSNQVTATPSMPSLIVDNEASVRVGSWTLSSNASGYGGDYRWASTAVGGTSSATFTAAIPVSGYYNVSEWHVTGTNRSTVAPYTVNYNGGSAALTVNQQVNNAQWNLLGQYPMLGGQNYTVVVRNAAPATFVVLADAIRWEYVAALPSGVEDWSLY
jgi:uncharacterized lipoprotein YddW (UPF0748 family)